MKNKNIREEYECLICHLVYHDYDEAEACVASHEDDEVKMMKTPHHCTRSIAPTPSEI